MLLSAAAILLVKNNRQAGDHCMHVDLKAIKMSDGWGYEVLVDKKIYIHQDCIPAIPSFRKFYSEADALLIGSRVVEKIKNGHKPAISLQEIEDAHIRY
jgi:hypothetical protein